MGLTMLTKTSPQIGVIPARYDSGRFPGKPLVVIMGKPMIVRTYLQAKKALSLERLVVATDDERIAEVCQAAGAEVVMTSRDCANGEQIGCSLIHRKHAWTHQNPGCRPS